MDEGGKLTDRELEALERRIAKLFKEAYKDINKQIAEYFALFEKRDAEMRELLDKGEIDKQKYIQWRLAQIGRGKRFEAMRDKIAQRMTEINEVAVAYINDVTPGVYTLNRNYEAYTIQQSHDNVSFTAWNEETVRRLAVEQPELMPYYPKAKAVKRGIDLAFGKRQIAAQVTSSILLGDGLKKMADKLQERLPNMNRVSAIRAARTAVTAAQNGGAQAAIEKAEAMGIELKRRWIATKDLRTRPDHGVADGQIVGVNEPFKVGGELLMFPGDPNGSGWNIYNCRCTIRSVEKDGIEAEPRMMRVRNPITGRNELVPEMTYDEWFEKYQAQDPKAVENAIKKIKNESSDRVQFVNYRALLGKEVPKTFAEFQDFKYNNPDKWESLKVKAKQTRFVNDAPCETTEKKYTGYFLKEGTKHARDFFSVGYSADNPLQLRYDMAQQFDIEKAVDRVTDAQGIETFNIYMMLGVDKKKRFRTCWQIDNLSDKPRIVTAFRRDK